MRSFRFSCRRRSFQPLHDAILHLSASLRASPEAGLVGLRELLARRDKTLQRRAKSEGHEADQIC